MKKYIIGVDGGNTKTDYLLFDLEGNFVDGLRSGTCSHEGLKDSFDGSYRVMKEQLEILFTRNNITVKDIAGAGFGLAGADVPYQKKKLNEIISKIGFENFGMENDGFLGVKAASPNGCGVCSINGTGTVTVGMDELVNQFIKDMKLASGLGKQRACEAWTKVSGAGRYTLDVSFEKGVMVCVISSSVVRNQLYFQRDRLLRGLNDLLASDELLSGTASQGDIVKTLILR
jgi:hypothetical protein